MFQYFIRMNYHLFLVITAVLACPVRSSTSLNITEELEYKLESLNPSFLNEFNQIYSQGYIQQLVKDSAQSARRQLGSYLLMLAKIYLYDIRAQKSDNQNPDIALHGSDSKARYMLAYFYFKVSAEIYENPHAFYYLSVLENLRITPTFTVKFQLEQKLKRMNSSSNSQDQQIIEEGIKDLKNIHLHHTEHNLYMGSLKKHYPSGVSLAYMFKQGIATESDCTTALAYYLQAVKNSQIDTFDFPLESKRYRQTTFERDLYRHTKADLSEYGDSKLDLEVLLRDSSLRDMDALRDMENLALLYLSGGNGLLANQTKAAEIFLRIKEQSKLSRNILSLLYIKGRGVEKDFDKAKKLLGKMNQKEEKAGAIKEIQTIMKYLGLGYPLTEATRKQAISDFELLYSKFTTYIDRHQKARALKQNTTIKELDQTIRTPLAKYMIGVLILAQSIKAPPHDAISLFEEAANSDSYEALSILGFLNVDGLVGRFDCPKGIEYFHKLTLKHPFYEQKPEMAKMGIKKNKLTYAMIKYIQLMMIGVNSAFINGYYLLEVYKENVFEFNRDSWSVKQASNSQVYQFLLRNRVFEYRTHKMSLQLTVMSTYGLKNYPLISMSQIANLTLTSREVIEQFFDFAKYKILKIGTTKHDISILKFYEYKIDNSKLDILETLAKSSGASMDSVSPHILQSRYLLGRHYQNHADQSTNEKSKKRALAEYQSATKNELLAYLIYLIEGGNLPESRIWSDFYVYISLVIVFIIVLQVKKRQKIEQIFQRQNAMRRQQSQVQISEEDTRLVQQTSPTGSHQQFAKPHFSEQQQEKLRTEKLSMQIRDTKVLEKQEKMKSSEIQQIAVQHRGNLTKRAEQSDEEQDRQLSKQHKQ